MYFIVALLYGVTEPRWVAPYKCFWLVDWWMEGGREGGRERGRDGWMDGWIDWL